VNDEVSPFIHPNDQVLYFASNGLTGFGGFDIYFSELEEFNWGQPQNIGFPINTGEDQVSLFISSDGSKGYYSHEDNNDVNRKGRIYEFDVPESSKVKYKSSYVFGRITDSDTNVPLGAKVELYDIKQDRRVGLVSSDSVNGNYLIVLTEGAEYALYVNKEGYLFKSLSFNYTGDDMKPVYRDIALEPLKSGASATLNNIFFDTDSYELRPESKTELQKIISFLKENNTTIEIGGHTDNVGTDSYNLNLSTNRAKSVYDFLIQSGISSKILKYRGYGSKNPIDTNNSELGRQNNRRIEFIIL
ncbi:MAG: OmpA family protein, partial [Bacteroidota bacterium]